MKMIDLENRFFWYLAAAIVLLALIILSMMTGKIVEWLWMSQVGYASIFWRLLSVKLLLFGIAFLCVFVYLWTKSSRIAQEESWRMLKGRFREGIGVNLEEPWND